MKKKELPITSRQARKAHQEKATEIKLKYFLKLNELEKKAWPDEKKRKEFMDAMNAYFEDWHGDALYRINPVLSK